MESSSLMSLLRTTLANYSKPFDDSVAALWAMLFKKFDEPTLRAALLAIVARNKFFPNASEIIDAYQQAQDDAERAIRKSQGQGVKTLSGDAEECYLCGDSGTCARVIEHNECAYQVYSRCICSHGRDLNKFSRSQIDLQHTPRDSPTYSERDRDEINRGKNPFYLPTIQEVLGTGFTVYDARKRQEFLSRHSNGVGKTDMAALVAQINAIGRMDGRL